MKPLYLSMTAFGPYKDKQEVDFREFRSGLYLITGDTGAGKTTIYDAVMFALFEETSNKPSGKDTEKGSVRDKTMVHSNFAPKSVPTVVELRFEEDGAEYTVTRTCKYSRKRGTADEYGDAKFDAELSGAAGTAETGSEKVTKKIEQIIGMDAVQFRQIVMLAQGEFKAFMEAKDNARKDILGKLFDSSAYVALMDSLAAAKQKLGKQAEAQQQRRAVIMAGDAFPLPDSMGTVERALYAPNHPQLLQNIRVLADRESAELETVDAAYTKADKALQELRAKLTTAEEHNKELAERDRLAAEQKRLEARKESIEELRKEAARAAKAVRAVLPAEDTARSAGVQAQRAQENLDKAKAGLVNANRALELAEAEAGPNPQRRQQAKEAREQAAKIETTLPDYEALEKTMAGLKNAEGKKAAAEDAGAEARRRQEIQQKKRDAAEAELKQLAGAEAAVVHAENAAKQAERLQKDLQGLTRKIGEIEKLDSRLKVLLADQTDARAVSDRAGAEYRALNDIFLSSQAALLAEKLRIKLQTNDTAVCPVCGKKACADDAAMFACLSGKAVTEEQVKAAREKSERTKHLFDTADRRLAEKVQERKSVLEFVLSEADRLLPEKAPWTEEVLLDGLSMRIVLREADDAASKASAALQTALQAQSRSRELEADRIKADEAVREASDLVAAQDRIAAEQKVLAEQYAQRRQELEAKLTEYPNRAAAQAAIEERKEKARRLDAEADHADERLQQAARAMAAADKAAEEREGQLQEAQTIFSKAKEAFAAAAAENGFADADDYRAALPGVEKSQYEIWLNRQGETISRYDGDVRNTAENLRRQQEKVKDYVFTALEELQQQEKERSAGVRKLLAEKTDRETILRMHRSAEEKIGRSLRESGRIEAAYRRVGLLADTAAGSNSDGGKHAFDGFVLGRYFREILQRATMHLDIMTGGRYTLVHESRGRSKASASDFVIQIRDQYNGEQREIGSISGGEGFQVSMALALGLSDVAQAHVHGGKRIEAMFIDEGFGTLDSEALGNMLAALKNVSGGSRLIGLISHVDSLEEVIPDRIEVKCLGERKGSCICRK